jgi:hypothetical protein
MRLRGCQRSQEGLEQLAPVPAIPLIAPFMKPVASADPSGEKTSSVKESVLARSSPRLNDVRSEIDTGRESNRQQAIRRRRNWMIFPVPSAPTRPGCGHSQPDSEPDREGCPAVVSPGRRGHRRIGGRSRGWRSLRLGQSPESGGGLRGFTGLGRVSVGWGSARSPWGRWEWGYVLREDFPEEANVEAASRVSKRMKRRKRKGGQEMAVLHGWDGLAEGN